MGSDYEFFSRPEWRTLKTIYDLNFKQLISLDPALMYQAINQNEVQVISAYSTDGRIIAHNLKALEDPKQALPPYDAVVLLSPKASQDEVLKNRMRQLIGKIDNETMRQANKLVDIDGKSINTAAEFLIENIHKIPDGR